MLDFAENNLQCLSELVNILTGKQSGLKVILHILKNGGIIFFVTISEIIGNSVVISNASISDSNILCIFPEKSKHQSCPSVNSVIQCILAWSDMPIMVTWKITQTLF